MKDNNHHILLSLGSGLTSLPSRSTPCHETPCGASERSGGERRERDTRPALSHLLHSLTVVTKVEPRIRGSNGSNEGERKVMGRARVTHFPSPSFRPHLSPRVSAEGGSGGHDTTREVSEGRREWSGVTKDPETRGMETVERRETVQRPRMNTKPGLFQPFPSLSAPCASLSVCHSLGSHPLPSGSSLGVKDASRGTGIHSHLTIIHGLKDPTAVR